jgi:transcriptional regulator with GAF, ATPase, and Fis domain
VTLEPNLLDLDLPDEAPAPPAPALTAAAPAQSSLRSVVDCAQRVAIRQALARFDGNWASAARAGARSKQPAQARAPAGIEELK